MDDTSVSVQSLQRAFLLIDILSRHPSGLTLGDLALRSHLHKSTAHRLLGSLIALGCVQNQGLYTLTPRLFELGCRAMEGMPSADSARLLLRDLSVRTGETAYLSVREGDEGLCIHKVESPSSVIREYSIGQRFPLHCTSAGKAMLAALPDDMVRIVWDRLNAKTYTPRTITRISELLNDLRRVRTQGYAVCFSEYSPEVTSVGCALPGTGEIAISVCCPASQLSSYKLTEMIAAVKELRDRIAT